MSDGEIFRYQTEDGQARIDVRLVNEEVWRFARQMVGLFQCDKSLISRHIRSVFDDGKLRWDADVANFTTPPVDGVVNRRNTHIMNRIRLSHLGLSGSEK